MYKIKKITAREIIDSRANPTIEVDLELQDGSLGRFSVPSGASTGSHEALEIRDNDKQRFLGKGVLQAKKNIEEFIYLAIKDKYFDDQADLDSFLIRLDGTKNKKNLGANAILGVSVAFAKAVANSKKQHFFEYIKDFFDGSEYKMPRPMFNIMNGGKHANWSTDIQEFMIIIKRNDYKEMLRIACEVFLNLEKLLKENNLSVNVGNEGGFAPGFNTNEEALDFISRAVEKSGYKLEKDVVFALDVAASEFFDNENKLYILKTENKELSSNDLSELYQKWINKYPIISIEDPFSEDDWDSWKVFTEKFENKIQIVGDDLLVTNIERIQKAIKEKSCNSLLVKMNQIGTLTETIEAIKLSTKNNWTNIVSHRSGETEDTTIAHLVVGSGCGQIKTGAPSRGERTCKYNELLRIQEILEK